MQSVQFTRAAHIAGGRSECAPSAGRLPAERIIRSADWPACICIPVCRAAMRQCSIDGSCARCGAGGGTGSGFTRLSYESAHLSHRAIDAARDAGEQRSRPAAHRATRTGSLFARLSCQRRVPSSGACSALRGRSESRPFTKGTKRATKDRARVRAIESAWARRTVGGGIRRAAESGARRGGARNTGRRLARRASHSAIFAGGACGTDGEPGGWAVAASSASLLPVGRRTE
jgi:hypothetical protein